MSDEVADVVEDAEETEAAPVAPVGSYVVLKDVPEGSRFRLPTGTKCGTVAKVGKGGSYVEVLYDGAAWPISIAPGMLVEVIGAPVPVEVQLVPAQTVADETAAKQQAEAEAQAAREAQAKAEAEAEAAREAQAKAEAEAEAQAAREAQAKAEAARQQAAPVAPAPAPAPAPQAISEKSEKPVSLSEVFTSMLMQEGNTIANFFKVARQVAPGTACASSLTSCQNQVQVLRSKMKKAGLKPKS